MVNIFRKIKRWLRSLIWRLRGYPPFDVRDLEDDDGVEYCQDCGCMLDWDMKGSGDDIIRPGYVTASGDVFCSCCGRAYDEEEERQDEEDADLYPWFDPYDRDDFGDVVAPVDHDADDAEDECTWDDEE